MFLAKQMTLVFAYVFKLWFQHNIYPDLLLLAGCLSHWMRNKAAPSFLIEHRGTFFILGSTELEMYHVSVLFCYVTVIVIQYTLKLHCFIFKKHYIKQCVIVICPHKHFIVPTFCPTNHFQKK